ncbi:malto-oligosyltrehalose trehalohydrolase [Desulfofundulus thermocisternus]|jgi:maltooligosyltrehalose trehalohydrolase|uniref:malto-oligosyltrehalose trehalohydrolase n=1 Tax=Desulfofundulus thermocisternus TaxID=42471 RepID=UPI000488F820|nr:malto-oligosyltrehalose trehalohydrolase [Desulfofundulus thermocisternus]
MHQHITSLPPGATCLGKSRCHFKVWAPRVKNLAVHILGPRERVIPLTEEKHGYFGGTVEGVEPGNLYYYLLDGEKERPDPASRHQPEGVHGPSQVVDLYSFNWNDHCWSGPNRESLVFYELHPGTFTREGTFEAIIPYLEELKELGITAIQLMPVAQFPGSRNWGYDGVYPYAVQNSYGGPGGLQRLVDACHQKGMALFLDVVYNHLGPEGNYLGDYAPYFTERYRTPWGPAINFDGPGSDEVRRYFIENALYWIRDYHIDGLRLDAVHAILDMSATHFLEELAEEVHREAGRLGRRVYVVAESDLNDARIIRPRAIGGYGLDAQWCDDFHHALHTLLTGERLGYYRDFGELDHLAKAFRQGYVYTGQYSEYRQRRHGNTTDLCRPCQFVVFSQNHDQVGNRAGGERLSNLATFEDLKLAAAAVILSPYLPLLFMGEEYGETAPFLYFTSHTDPALVEAVRKGRREEFSAFAWQEIADPQDEQTFLRSRLNRALRHEGHHRVLYEFYRELLRLRREVQALGNLERRNMEVHSYPGEQVLVVQRWERESRASLILSFNDLPVHLNLPLAQGHWQKILDAAEERWLGSGSTVPPVLFSPGRVELTLPPKACLLLELER